MIPELAFNDKKTPIMTGSLSAAANLANAYRKIIDYSSENCERDFQSKTASIEINGLSVSSISSGGIYFETENYKKYCLAIPLVGNCETNINGVKHQYGFDDTGLFGIWESQKSYCVGSSVAIHLRSERLSKTCSVMFGSPYQSGFHDHSQVKSTTVNGFSFKGVLENLLSQIDAVGGDENILNKLALDDSFYRLCVGLLYPDLFLRDETHGGKRPYVRPEIKRLCEYIIAHLTAPISLTEMENRSGLSTRVLQSSFQNTYGLTPKQWVRKQRLHAARRLLLETTDLLSITSVAYEFCFASPSVFAHYYWLEFGENPSQTARRIG